MIVFVILFYEDEIVLEGDFYVSLGDLVEFKMKMGIFGNLVENVYGFIFLFFYNLDLVVLGFVFVDFEFNSWLIYNLFILYMQWDDQEGMFNVGFICINVIVVNGYGVIGLVSFVINDDIEGFCDDDGVLVLQVGGGFFIVMNGSGSFYGINIGGVMIYICLDEEVKDELFDVDQLKFYLNLINWDFINVYLNGQ